MLHKTLIVLATAAALTGGLTADASARGGGGGGGHMGGGGGHGGGGAGTRGRFDHDKRLRFGFGPGDYGFYDYGCNSGYPYYNPYSCYPPAY